MSFLFVCFVSSFLNHSLALFSFVSLHVAAAAAASVIDATPAAAASVPSRPRKLTSKKTGNPLPVPGPPTPVPPTPAPPTPAPIARTTPIAPVVPPTQDASTEAPTDAPTDAETCSAVEGKECQLAKNCEWTGTECTNKKCSTHTKITKVEQCRQAQCNANLFAGSWTYQNGCNEIMTATIMESEDDSEIFSYQETSSMVDPSASPPSSSCFVGGNFQDQASTKVYYDSGTGNCVIGYFDLLNDSCNLYEPPFGAMMYIPLKKKNDSHDVMYLLFSNDQGHSFYNNKKKRVATRSIAEAERSDGDLISSSMSSSVPASLITNVNSHNTSELPIIRPRSSSSSTCGLPDEEQEQPRLFWYDLFGQTHPWDPNSLRYRAATNDWTYSAEDCSFLTEDWFDVADVNDCKNKCMERNIDFDYRLGDADTSLTVPPSCTSISFDPLYNQCALRRCTIFPMMLPEMSIQHKEMAKLFPRYGGDDRTSSRPYTLIQDYILHVFDDSFWGDSRCPYPYETFRRIRPGETDNFTNEHGYVCELNEDRGPEWVVDQNFAPSDFFDRNPPLFRNCWEGMSEAFQEEKYLTYWFAVRIEMDWKQHYEEYKDEFKQYGYSTVEDSVNIVWNKAQWILREQFRIDVRINRVAVPNADGLYPFNPWVPGDAGLVILSNKYAGGGGVNQMCTSYDMRVGDYLFDRNKHPGRVHLLRIVHVLAHELVHHLGQSHGPVYRADLFTADGTLSNRRCIDHNNPTGKKKVCNYRSFLPLKNVWERYQYQENLCKHIRSEEALSCAMLKTLEDDDSSRPFNRPPSDGCPSKVTLCADPTTCKYALGKHEWEEGGNRDGCAIEGYKSLFREGDSERRVRNRSNVLSKESEEVCKRALQDMIDMGIDIQIGTDIRTEEGEEKDPIFAFNVYDRAVGCYVECVDGVLRGFINVNNGNFYEEVFANNNAKPLCIKSSADEKVLD